MRLLPLGLAAALLLASVPARGDGLDWLADGGSATRVDHAQGGESSMTLIFNLTQHTATAEQRDAGVVDLPPAEAARRHALLTFTELPDAAAVTARAHALAALAASHGATAAMIGGAPFLMAPLCHALLNAGIQPLFAFSQRRVEEHRRPDGTVERVALFQHEGFVRPYG